MTESPVIEMARGLAYAAHGFDHNSKSGERYIEHPKRVAGYVDEAFALLRKHGILDDSHLHLLVMARAVAWLHDTVEDTWVTLEILRTVFRSMVDGSTLVEGVRLLTFDGVNRGAYYAAIALNMLALLVKFADLMDNGDPQRLALLEDRATAARLERKYLDAAEAMGVSAAFAEWRDTRS